jgi:hypothetical protein
MSNNKENKTAEKHYKNILQKNEYITNLLEKPLTQPQKNIHEEPKHKKKNWPHLRIAEKN